MNLIRKLSIGSRLARNRLLGIRRPVMASWSITNRCNADCRYCCWPSQPSEELNTDQGSSLLREMGQSGVRLLVFTGGEPLLRTDLSDLLRTAKQEGMVTGINTNGLLLPDQYETLQAADFFQLSLDGPEPVNDAIRGEGAYAATLNALELLKGNHRSVKLNTTMTTLLEGHLDLLLEIGREFDAPILFHPVSSVHAGDRDISALRMSEEQLRAFIEGLIEAKKRGHRILNSISGLKRLAGIPTRKPPRCYWWLSINLTPEGHVIVCNQRRLGFLSVPATEGRFRQAIASLPDPNCERCWCANPMEMNLLMAFDWETIRNVLQTGF